MLPERREPTFRVSGDTVVEIYAPNGDLYTIRYVGIGHPWHAVGPKGGRVATGTEYLLAKALIAVRNGAGAAEATPMPVTRGEGA